MKKYFLVVLLLIPIITFASDNQSFMVGGVSYDTLEEAIYNAKSNETITMFSNAKLDETYEIKKVVNIDLNGNNISAPSSIFLVNGGTLNIIGKGTLRELEPSYGVIRVMGNTINNDELYSKVNIGKDVTLEGWSGINISHNANKAYGVSVEFDGTINSKSDIFGDTGIGIYVNGSIQHEDNNPVINILDNAKITSNGTGLYIAGYSTFNIKKAYIEGDESGIAIKSGKLNIDGANIVCNGLDTTPTEGYNNGVKSSGTSIQIESNSGYAGNMEIDISRGTFKSKNSSVIYEYIGKGDTTQVKSISISGGTFESGANKNIFLLSNNFKSTHPHFISGGKFSSNPTDYLKSGYSSNLENGKYNVSKSAMAVFSEKVDNSNTFSNVTIILSLIVVSIILFVNRNGLFKYFKKVFNK